MAAVSNDRASGTGKFLLSLSPVNINSFHFIGYSVGVLRKGSPRSSP